MHIIRKIYKKIGKIFVKNVEDVGASLVETMTSHNIKCLLLVLHGVLHTHAMGTYVNQ